MRFTMFHKHASSDTTTTNKPDVIVIGGGVAGILSALELAKDCKVFLFEKNPELLSATSKNQSYRLHTGLHYPDDTFVTSIKCLYDTVAFIRAIPHDCIYMQTSRYYLMSNSPYDQAHMKKTIKLLQAAYQQLIQDDPNNTVLGDPKDLIRIVKPEEYNSYVGHAIPFTNKDKSKTTTEVVFVVDIIEPQIRIDVFRQYLIKKMRENSNITLFLNHEVQAVKQLEDDFGYKIDAIEKTKSSETVQKTFFCDGIVNCSWEQTESLNPPEYNQFYSGDIMNRMKASLLVQLPITAKDIPTSLFCYGPHAAISILEDKKGVITWEPTTNMGSWLVGSQPSEEQLRTVIGRENELTVDSGIGGELTQSIIKGFSQYIPGLKGVTPLEIRIGYVRTPITAEERKQFSIYDRDSSIRWRREGGVEPLIQIFSSCYIVNEARKFTYGITNAMQVRSLMSTELKHMRGWRELFLTLSTTDHIKFTVLRSTINQINIALSACLLKLGPEVLPLVVQTFGVLNGGVVLMQQQLDKVIGHCNTQKGKLDEMAKILSLIKKLQDTSHVTDTQLEPIKLPDSSLLFSGMVFSSKESSTTASSVLAKLDVNSPPPTLQI